MEITLQKVVLHIFFCQKEKNWYFSKWRRWPSWIYASTRPQNTTKNVRNEFLVLIYTLKSGITHVFLTNSKKDKISFCSMAAILENSVKTWFLYSQHSIFAKKVHWQKSIYNFHEAKKYDIAEWTRFAWDFYQRCFSGQSRTIHYILGMILSTIRIQYLHYDHYFGGSLPSLTDWLVWKKITAYRSSFVNVWSVN